LCIAGTPMNQSRHLSELINDVEELLAELSDEHSPQIDELRKRIKDTIRSVRPAGARIRRYAGAVDDYITGYPRLGFLTGLLIGGVIVYMGALIRPAQRSSNPKPRL
jgi:gas vesicle protein